MKQLMIGVAGAVIGGFLLFIAQVQYSGWTKSSEDRVTIKADDQPVVLNSAAVEKLYQASKASLFPVTFYLQRFTVKNTGTNDLSGKSFSSPILSPIGLGTIRAPNSNEKNALLSSDGRIVTVRYKILPKNAEHVFWIASSDYLGSTQNFAADDPGMTVVNGLATGNDTDVWFVVWVGLGGTFIFFVGLYLGYAGLRSELIPRGINVDAALKAPRLVPDQSTDPARK